MIQGSTPTHYFKLPINTSLVKECRVLYGQNDVLIFKKTTEDCVLYDDTIEVTLTQADTFNLTLGQLVQIQLRVLTTDGDALVTPIHTVSITSSKNLI